MNTKTLGMACGQVLFMRRRSPSFPETSNWLHLMMGKREGLGHLLMPYVALLGESSNEFTSLTLNRTQ